MADLPPFKVARDGIVTDRASGARIGWVGIDPDQGWIGLDIEGRPVVRAHWNGRKYAARAVWEESAYYVQPPTYQHQEASDG